ncbi:PREDICTED: tripeptidyl-peptidase 1-like [Amphimedon queenslandica]|uniref:Peptidase S53 domain-containing protein n=1 Tax=Amphimedon queenslandica TaxID=400682 RepID=A0A1X7UID3_AMPQE|nr:PREDICTED: tripeptidyl-peptidase 1-like [Amphimedon queenslandica]|eukprot:XP_003387882.1 PREDICTED: tripeptidyl-peptidase 1-like [Amphimedon queenslandica]
MVAAPFLFAVLLFSFVHADNEDWIKIGRPLPNKTIKVTLALKQTNRQWLENTLKEVSDPESLHYGRYLSLDEIVTHVHAYPEGVAQTTSYFASNGLRADFTLGGGFAVVEMPVSVAETMFSANFFAYEHKTKKGFIVYRSEQFSTPNMLKPHLCFISGITDFPKTRISPRFSQPGNDTDGDVTPSYINKAYNISGYASTSSNNSQAIAGFLSQYFSPSDLAHFQKEYNIPQNPIKKIVGKNDGNDQGIEANLDVQYITGIGRNVDTWFISVSSHANGNQEDFMTWVVELINNTDTPWVHSVSYGDYESSIDPAFMDRVDEEFMKLGISGRSLLFASGDFGTACSLLKGGRFEPMWPASSPYVTAVGGTVSMDECWDHGGGGFSNHYSTPDYQTDAVATYLKSGAAPNDKYFNSSGRGYPDVSVFSVSFLIVYIDLPWPVDGTSCASPTTAGMISLLNDVRLNAGLSTLGFINPLLYKLSGNGFFDITKGSNHGTIWCKGFEATSGWDPASGWGSPNFGLMKDIVLI